jgi:uncharacterized protein YdeI (YjbR/CyaY-like superfamily)
MSSKELFDKPTKEKSPMVIPKELMLLLESNPNAQNFFNTLSHSCQREYITYVADAKKEETRISRSHKTIEALLNLKKYRA